MKRKRVTRIALILGVSLLALSLFAGVALAAGGAKNQVRDRTKSQLCDGRCRAPSAGTTNGVQARTQSKAKTQTRSQLRDGTCPNASGTATVTKTQARDRARSRMCDGSCKTK
jgi:hypothetical protein